MPQVGGRVALVLVLVTGSESLIDVHPRPDFTPGIEPIGLVFKEVENPTVMWARGLAGGCVVAVQRCVDSHWSSVIHGDSTCYMRAPRMMHP